MKTTTDTVMVQRIQLRNTLVALGFEFTHVFESEERYEFVPSPGQVIRVGVPTLDLCKSSPKDAQYVIDYATAAIAPLVGLWNRARNSVAAPVTVPAN